MKKILLYSIFLSFCFSGLAQSPKREFRATWLTTVYRNDWPKSTVITSTGNSGEIQMQKNEMIAILDSLKRMNANSVCFQVRSRCDAMYKSSYEPWSSDLVGTRGMDPGYDPLAFVVQEGHKRGIEVHTWINPYRFESVTNQWSGLPGDYRSTHPEWLLTYPATNNSILNPGHPEVLLQIKKIVAEIVKNYDIDGVIFDDYFYVSGTTDAMDDAQYKLYNPDKLSRGDWRRQNVNKMVRGVRDTIKSVKPYVKFGISPAGVAASSQTVANKYGVTPCPGSDWQYNDIYSDPLAWLSEGTIDYISPQIYWTIGSANDYAKLCTWWSFVANKFGRHFYSSHSLSAMTAGGASAPRMMKVAGQQTDLSSMSGIERNAVQWNSGIFYAPSATNFYASEIGNQVNLNRQGDLNGAPGSIFFPTKPVQNIAGFISYIRKYQYTNPALPPAVNWGQNPQYGLVTGITLTGNVLTWTNSETNVRYTVYAIPNDKVNLSGNFSTSAYLTGISYQNSFTVPAGISTTTNTFAVAVLDRYGNEYPPQLMGQSPGSPVTPVLISPSNNGFIYPPVDFKWNADPTVEYFTFEVAEDLNFTKIIYRRDITTNTFPSSNINYLKDNGVYYWRVKSRKANTPDGVSDVRSFTLHKFAVISPTNGSTGVSLTPTISWDNVSATATYTLELSTTQLFTTILYSSTQSTASAVIPENVLNGSTTYYVRVKVTDGNLQTTTDAVSFTTMILPVPIPEITRPVNGDFLTNSSLEVCWKQQNSNGFRAELSESNTFPPRGTTVKTVDANTNCVIFTNLATEKIYFVRVFALTTTGMTESSVVVTVNMNTSIGQNSADGLDCYLKTRPDGVSELIVWSSENINAQISLYNLIGMLLFDKNCNISQGINVIDLNIDGFRSGVYPLLIRTEKNKQTIKLKK